MKSLSISLSILWFLALLAVVPTALRAENLGEPGWYRKLEAAPSRIVGYGAGPSREQALLSAREEAAAQLGVEVHSAVSRRIIDDNRKVSSISEVKAEAKVARRLINSRVLREDHIGSTHFVAIEADLRDTQKRLADDVLARYGKVVSYAGPPQLAASPLMQGVRELLAGAERTTASLDLALGRTGDDWRLRVGDLTLTIDRDDFPRAIEWAAGPKHALTLLAIDDRSGQPVSRLHSGQTFHLRLANPAQKSFYSIFNVYADGRVTLLAENLTVEKNARDLSFPGFAERERGTVLEAARSDQRAIDTDTYIVVGSPSRLQNQRILSQKDRVVEEGGSFAADLLLTLLTSNAITAYGAATLLIE